jgi:aconitate hydratase 2/2-methylisocitrate dehydratase
MVRRRGAACRLDIAPIFFKTAKNTGTLPIQCDVPKMETGIAIAIHPYLVGFPCAEIYAHRGE